MNRIDILKLLRLLLDNPYTYTKKQLAERIERKETTIKEYIKSLRYAGFEINCDKQYRYAFEETKRFKHLQALLYFTEEEQAMVKLALDSKYPNKDGQRIKKKLSNFYDYKRLGFYFLQKSHLTKIDTLEEARKTKHAVKLIQYHSTNSNKISDRLVECFYISTADDMMYAFDIQQQGLRNFRVSRAQAIERTDIPWQFENKHLQQATDPFRIVNLDQVWIHLRFTVGAYNSLVEQFPLTRACIQPDPEQPNVYDFEARVNAGFMGVTNFILGNHHLIIEIVHPQELKDHLKKEIELFSRKL